MRRIRTRVRVRIESSPPDVTSTEAPTGASGGTHKLRESARLAFPQLPLIMVSADAIRDQPLTSHDTRPEP